MKVQHQRHDMAAEMTGMRGDWRSTLRDNDSRLGVFVALRVPQTTGS